MLSDQHRSEVIRVDAGLHPTDVMNDVSVRYWPKRFLVYQSVSQLLGRVAPVVYYAVSVSSDMPPVRDTRIVRGAHRCLIPNVIGILPWRRRALAIDRG
jgi:hypothetical protein